MRLAQAFRIGILAAFGLLTSQATGQPPDPLVDCGNGNFCPYGYACLLDGMCGKLVNALADSVKTSRGGWCDPGSREHKYVPGRCIPAPYVDCPSGGTCPPGATCSTDGKSCIGAPPTTGPECGTTRCAEGHLCSSKKTCIDPEYVQDCGNGTICSKWAACALPNLCAQVAKRRIRQFQ